MIGRGENSRVKVRLRRLLAACHPADLLFGPVFQRDMRIMGRRRGTYVTRAAYLLVLLVIVFFVFLSMSQQMAWGSPASRLQRFQELAPAIALTVVWAQFFLLGLLSSSLTAGAISDERRAGTLTTLLSTPLTAGEVLFGKLVGRIMLMLILALSSAPLLLAVRIFGGIDAETILSGTAVALATAILGATLGLFQSTLHKSSRPGTAVAGFLLLLANGGPIGLAFALNLPWFNGSTEWVVATCAPMVLFSITSDSLMGGGGGGAVFELWRNNVIYNFLLCLLAGGTAAAVLRPISRADVAGKPPSRKRGRRKAAGAARPPVASAANGVMHVASSPSETAPFDPVPAEVPSDVARVSDADATIREAQRDRVVGDNPVLWRELRISAFRKRWHLILAILAAVALLLGIYIRFGLMDATLHYTIVVIGACGLLLQAAVQSTSGIGAEREARTLPVLLATPMTSWEVLFGKFLGTARRNWLVLTIIQAHLLVAVIAQAVHPVAIVLVPAVLMGPILFLNGTGLLLGTVLKRSVTASTLNLLLALCVWLFSWFGMAMLGVAGLHQLSEGLADLNFKINPVALVVSSLAGTVADPTPDMRFMTGVDGEKSAGVFFIIVFFNLIVYSAAGVSAVALAAKHFRTLMQRNV